MLLEALGLCDFRNLGRVDLTPHHRFNVLTGANGQGKTNLLEAIYLLGSVDSFRGRVTNRQLVRFGAEKAILRARIRRGGHVRRVRIEITKGGKKVFLNEEPVRNLSEFFGTLNVVVFGPDDIDILKGSPSNRRRFIDRAIFNARPAFGTETSQYDDIVDHRNALLKKPDIDETLLSVYDDQFVEWGARILQRRIDFIDHFQPILERTFRSIFGADLRATIAYDATWTSADIDTDRAVDDEIYLEQLLSEALERSRRRERERGYTVVGPHRDDLATAIDGRDVRDFASQGQTRAFVLAMKIAEINYLQERYHFAPILLLDDVSSELDRTRNEYLFDYLRQREQGQVFITTTHRDHILLDEQLRWFDVDAGQVEVVE